MSDELRIKIKDELSATIIALTKNNEKIIELLKTNHILLSKVLDNSIESV